MNKEEIKEILRLHLSYIFNEEGGVRANLVDNDLRGNDLKRVDLSFADLRGVDLRGVELNFSVLEASDLRGANLRGADLRNTSLKNSDLRNVRLEGADLLCANFHNTIGNKKEIKTYQFEKYIVNIVKEIGVIQIGCENHTYEEWFNFTDEEISEMDEGALEWWNKHKEIIKQLYKMA